ncbi:acetoacetate-CoA ligase, partial [Candidatus Marsarchaeota G2 archaeon ECH_B_SAG-G16]
KIKKEIATKISPSFVPDLVLQVSEIPKTLNGKKLEVPVKRILMGENAEKVVNKEALLNPESLEQFGKLSKLFT